MGEADIAAILAALAVPSGDEEGIWPENADILAAFLSVSSQWRLAALAGGMAPSRLLYLGLDYAGARAGIEAAGMTISAGLWTGLQVMERAACDALNGFEG